MKVDPFSQLLRKRAEKAFRDGKSVEDALAELRQMMERQQMADSKLRRLDDASVSS